MKRRPKLRRWALHTPTTYQLDPEQMAAAGIHEPITFTVPAGFERYTAAQRRAWGAAQVRAEVAMMAREMLTALGMAEGPAMGARVAEIVGGAPLPAVSTEGEHR